MPLNEEIKLNFVFDKHSGYNWIILFWHKLWIIGQITRIKQSNLFLEIRLVHILSKQNVSLVNKYFGQVCAEVTS